MYNGKKVDLRFVDDPSYQTVQIKVEGREEAWGTFRFPRQQITLDGEPAVLAIHDGREYFLKEKKGRKFSLYKMVNTTVLVTSFDRFTGWHIKRDVELISVTEIEPDYALLALVAFWEVLFFCGQYSFGY